MHILSEVLKSITEVVSAWGYMGVAIGMLLESACIPIPSELILPLGGNMVLMNPQQFSLLGVNIAVGIGSMIGSMMAYWVGYFGGRPFILKYGKYFFVSEKHFYLAEKTFNHYGKAAVFFGRLLPVIRTFISLPAGIAKMDVKQFLLYSLVGMIPWNALLIFLGYKFGQNYEMIVRPIFHNFEYFVIGAIVFVVLFFVVKCKLANKKA